MLRCHTRKQTTRRRRSWGHADMFCLVFNSRKHSRRSRRWGCVRVVVTWLREMCIKCAMSHGRRQDAIDRDDCRDRPQTTSCRAPKLSR